MIAVAGHLKRQKKLTRISRGRILATLQSAITTDPARRSRGDIRITVYDVLECLSSGMTKTEIIREFQELTAEDIRACLVFAAAAGCRPIETGIRSRSVEPLLIPTAR